MYTGNRLAAILQLLIPCVAVSHLCLVDMIAAYSTCNFAHSAGTYDFSYVHCHLRDSFIAAERDSSHSHLHRYVERFVASVNTSPQNVGCCEKSSSQSNGLHTGLSPLLKLLTSKKSYPDFGVLTRKAPQKMYLYVYMKC